VSPAYPARPEGGANEENLVRSAALFASTRRDDGMVALCDGACSSAFAADGQRCGDTSKAPVFFSALEAAGQRWRADWANRGARRIDRIEIYAVRGTEAASLDGAQILVDDFEVATYPAGEAGAAFVFEPPLYGSSVEVRKTGGSLLLGLAEVEVWSEREAPAMDVAFQGAVRSSSVFSPNEVDRSAGAGVSADAGATRTVDGRADTEMATKAFLRGGSLALEGQAWPYDTGNQDEAPLIGRDSAWWLLRLGRGQRIRSLQIHRGSVPTALDGAQVFFAVDGVLEATPRFVLPAGGEAIEVLRPATPVADVTAVKIASAVDATAAPGDPSQALRIREVRVFADVPARGAGPLRDLSTRARPTSSIDGLRVRAVGETIDGSVATGDGAEGIPAWLRFAFDEAHDVRGLEVHQRTDYPGTFFYSPPGSGCPSRPLCGDSYGGCSFRGFGSVIAQVDELGGAVGAPVGTLDWEHHQSFAFERRGAAFEIRKSGSQSVYTAACSVGYQTESFVHVREARLLGYWGSGVAPLMDYARAGNGAVATHSPGLTGNDASFAIDAWRGWPQATTGSGDQELRVDLARPVRAERIAIYGVDSMATFEATLEVRVDGGEWVTVTTLPQRTNHVIDLPARRLVDAVRLRKTTGVLSVYELEVLAPANY